jgi:hypothetical protein
MKNENFASEQPLWHAPKLQALGNLRDFVRHGNANGKSGTMQDGNSMCGGEAMDSIGACTP